MKIFHCIGTKEKICKYCEQQTMYNQLMQRVEGAKDHVVCDPDQGKPACPVAAAEHEHSANNRRETDEGHPYDVILKRMQCLELDEVVSKSEGGRCYEYATDDGDGGWTFVHRVSMCANSCAALQWCSDKGLPLSECCPKWIEDTFDPLTVLVRAN